jgi:predicted TIM-barrel fold metal-dependent hydrolase
LLGGASVAASCTAVVGATPVLPVTPPPAVAIDVDIHCHTFCSADLPIVGFVAHHIPGLTELSRLVTRWPELVVRALVGAVTQLTNAVAPAGEVELASLRGQLAASAPAPITGFPSLPTQAVDDILARLAKNLPFEIGADKRQLVARYLDTLYLAAHPRAAIAAALAETFPTVTLFTPSLVDYDAWSEDAAPTPLATQIQIQEAISRLSVQGRIGRADARFHPFVAFDPRREVEAAGTALTMVRQAIATAGFVGVKLYPPVGFAPLDNARLRPKSPLSPRLDGALRAFYAYCEAEEVPITTHAGSANEFGLGFRELVAPLRWQPVLERHPSLRLNFGHFGHDYGVGGSDTAAAWIHQAAGLIQRYPNVYADLSNSPLVYDAAYAGRMAILLREVVARAPRVKRRLMYGSDWWLSRLDPDATLAVTRFRATLAEVLAAEEVADVMGRNALRFLGLVDDTNRPRAGKTAARLRKFYGTAPPPPWLPVV